MIEHLQAHPWHLVLGLAVILFWCVIGWCRLAPEKAIRSPQALATGRTTSISWAEDVRRGAHEDLEGVCERWRDRLPPR